MQLQLATDFSTSINVKLCIT